MKKGYNRVVLAGSLVRDPELRTTARGIAVAACTIAINRNWRQEDAQLRSETTFVDFNCFDKPAETLARYAKKGDKLLIEGRLRQNKWQDKETGKSMEKLSVVIDDFVFLNSIPKPQREPSEESERQSWPRKQYNDTPQASNQPTPPADDDDVPF